MIQKSISILAALFLALSNFATPLASPDGKTTVTVDCKNGVPFYTVMFEGNIVIEASSLGLDTKAFGLKETSRIKAFVFSFISVPAKWIMTARQYVLNIYTENRAYARPFKTGFG